MCLVGEEGPIEHVVFVVHGIGPVADLRMRSIVDCGKYLGNLILDLLNLILDGVYCILYCILVGVTSAYIYIGNTRLVLGFIKVVPQKSCKKTIYH